MTWLVRIVLFACVALANEPVSAEVAVDLRARDPVAGLPVVSANKLNFLRAYRRWRKGCKQPDIFVEDGGIDASVSEPQYSSTPLIGGCGEAIDTHEGNVNAINESMRSTQCSTAAQRGSLSAKLPAQFDVAGLRVNVTATAGSAHVTINRLDSRASAVVGGRRMELRIAASQVSAWYVVDAGTRRQLAVMLTGHEKDGTVAEQWMEVWASKAAAKPQPIDVARSWLLAVAAQDTAALARLTGTPFERVGFETPSDAVCAKQRTARKASDLASLLGCVVAAGTRYVDLYDEQEFSKITKPPPELKAHAKLLGKNTLVQFATDGDRESVVIVLSIKNSKVVAVTEHVTTR